VTLGKPNRDEQLNLPALYQLHDAAADDDNDDDDDCDPPVTFKAGLQTVFIV
jgi:hypothetical protein